MNTKIEMSELLKEYPHYRENLFIRGYLITEEEFRSNDGYPFYGNWIKSEMALLNNGGKLKIYYPLFFNF